MENVIKKNIDSNRRILIPKEIREELGLDKDSNFYLILDEDHKEIQLLYNMSSENHSDVSDNGSNLKTKEE